MNKTKAHVSHSVKICVFIYNQVKFYFQFLFPILGKLLISMPTLRYQRRVPASQNLTDSSMRSRFYGLHVAAKKKKSTHCSVAIVI